MSAAPAKDRKQVVVISVFGVLLLLFLIYAYNAFFGGTANPAAVSAPVPVNAPAGSASRDRAQGTDDTENAGNAGGNNPTHGMGVAPGVAAKMMASTSSSLDPTLHESAMLRTESLVYSGTGRNIFSATYTAPVVIPKNMPNARPGGMRPVPAGPPPPPPLPPINLKFFGTAIRSNGARQAFLLNGEDVYLAAVGDIVARKYKILGIGTTSIEVEDLQDNNRQSLPLQVR